MQIRNVFLTFSLVIILAVAIGALVMRTNPDIQDTPLTVTQESPLQDGGLLLSGRCARCHTVELIKQSKQTRAEWENTLAKMQKMGAALNADEKTVLVDYLTGIDQP
jgi:hypothetical protein